MLRNRQTIVTTRVDAELLKYAVGDVVLTEWGDKYVVRSVRFVKNIQYHPFLLELTRDQRNALNQYSAMGIVTLNLVKKCA